MHYLEFRDFWVQYVQTMDKEIAKWLEEEELWVIQQSYL